MIIDGKGLATEILNDLKSRVTVLKNNAVMPALTVILVGDDLGSLSYIKQKQKAADEVGIHLNFVHLPQATTKEVLHQTIKQYNSDLDTHGLIVQRPVPIPDCEDVLETVQKSKDVDGFIAGTPYRVPVAAAVVKILERCYLTQNQNATRNQFLEWLPLQQISVIGRGSTAGRPVKELLEKLGSQPMTVHSHTQNGAAVMSACDIIVSCVGKPEVVKKEYIKPGAYVISVGLWRDEQGKLHGDYDEEQVADVAGFYTPTPGGVGPVNVACLMENVVIAAETTG